MKKEIDTLLQETLERLNHLDDAEDLERLRVEVLGRKGKISRLFNKLGQISAQKRPEVGKILNEARAHLQSAIKEAEDRTKSGLTLSYQWRIEQWHLNYQLFLTRKTH